MPRARRAPSAPSPIARLWQRERDAALALARRPPWTAPVVVETTPAALVRAVPERWPRVWRAPVVGEVVTPPPSAGEGGGESDAGKPVSERDQRVGVVAKARGILQKPAQNMPKIIPTALAPAHPPGAWPITDLGLDQCRFACTPHTAGRDGHRFCGAQIAWRKGRPTSWCEAHLPVICGAPGRSAGGASVADVAAGAASPAGGRRSRDDVRTGAWR